eukprot:332986-Pelagomonas_calceolata.AAC.6
MHDARMLTCMARAASCTARAADSTSDQCMMQTRSPAPQGPSPALSGWRTGACGTAQALALIVALWRKQTPAHATGARLGCSAVSSQLPACVKSRVRKLFMLPVHVRAAQQLSLSCLHESRHIG